MKIQSDVPDPGLGFKGKVIDFVGRYLNKTINPLSLFMKQIFKMKSGKMSRRGTG